MKHQTIIEPFRIKVVEPIAMTSYKERKQHLADAHYNLSRLYELVGEHAEALKHLKTYRSLIDPH